MSAPFEIGYGSLLVLFAALVAIVWFVMRARLMRARAAERLAVEQRDRFFTNAAAELEAPLVTLRERLAALDSWSVTPERVGGLTRDVDRLRDVVRELGRVPAPIPPEQRVEVDLAELTREIIAQPPFSDRGPSVILRASPTVVAADRARLANGLRVLLWVVRRDVAEAQSMVVTVSGDEDAAYVEVDAAGGGELADALEQLPAVSYGLAAPVGAPGTTLALRVANQVARVHGGRLSASARVGQGERFVLALPRAAGH